MTSVARVEDVQIFLKDPVYAHYKSEVWMHECVHTYLCMQRKNETKKENNKLYGTQEYINFPKLEVPLFSHNCLILSDMC